MNKQKPTNILDWAEIVGDLLHLVPHEDRAAVLAAAAKDVAEYDPRPMELDEIPSPRDRRRTMPLRSMVATAFTMGIVKNTDPKDADRLMFMKHWGPGSPTMLDYIYDLPTLQRRVRMAR